MKNELNVTTRYRGICPKTGQPCVREDCEITIITRTIHSYDLNDEPGATVFTDETDQQIVCRMDT